jgi:alpha-glucosidase
MPEFVGQLPVREPSWSTIESVASIDRFANGIAAHCLDAQGNRSLLDVRVLTDNLVRVRFAPSGKFSPRRSWAVALADEAFDPVAVELRETEETIQLLTSQMRVGLRRDSGSIACYDSADRPFAHDHTPGIGWRLGAVAGWKQIAADDHFYGFGQRTGLLDKRSQRLTNWTSDALDFDSLTDEMYQAIPFFIALRPEVCYGLFFNTTFKSQFDMGAAEAGVWQMQTQGSELDYYILYGATPAQILQTYAQLTGRMPLPPKWAIGYHQCRWSYDSDPVVRNLAQEFRDRRIPCDVIHLDIDYMRGFRVFTWNPQRFPDPKALVSDLAQNGFKVVTIVDPGVKFEPEADYAVFDQGLAQDYFVRTAQGKLFHGYVWPDRAVFPDFLRPDVQTWWGDCQKALTETGVAGIWNDMNEPAMNDRPFGDPGSKMWFPLDAPQGAPAERTTHAEARNLYGLGMAQASHEGLQRLRPTERSFVLTRSGFAGVQRYSSVWMGDNHSLWDYLEGSLPMLCNMGLSGVAFVGCDIGGFAGNATAELFARWMQVGLLYPLMRAHSIIGSERHEPWVFGDRVERICREYIELRYRLLPYLYTLFWQAAATGAPILRPLLYEFPNDPKTYSLYDQVFLGASLMAAPIYRPGVEHRAVYLPEGTWYDWWSGDRHKGAAHILAHAPLEQMPLYVRAGSIIPMQPVMQYVDERPIDELTLRVWSGNGTFTLYEDDGHSFAYQQGAWSTTHYQVRVENNQTIVEIQSRQGNWTPPDRTVIVEVVGVGTQQFQDDGSDRRLMF